jgi:MFS family permease
MLLSALVLDFLKKVGIERGQELVFTAIGFVLFLALAGFFKLMAVKSLSKQYEPKIVIRKKDQSGLLHFLKNSNKSPLGKFAWFSFAIRVAMGVAAPFYIIFLLQEHQFSYFWYMGFLVSGIAFQILFLPILGKASDKFGNIALLRTCSLALAVVPLLVLIGVFIPQKGLMIAYLLIVPQILSGFGMAGFNLATNNYLYDCTSPQKRGYALTHLNLLTGTGLFIGALIASTLSAVKISFLSVSILAFLISSVLRFIVVIAGQKTLQEVREVRPFSSTYFLREIHPLRSAINQVHHSNHQGGKIIHHI